MDDSDDNYQPKNDGVDHHAELAKYDSEDRKR